MARIRTIKPEFFTSEDIVALSAFARLLYIALWCEADREGRMVWKPKTFKMRYFPADDIDINALCDEITNAGLVNLYGEGYAYVPAFHAHQHINPRETTSQLPEPSKEDAKPTRKARVNNASPRDSDAQGGREGKGKEGDTRDASRVDAPPGFAGFWEAWPNTDRKQAMGKCLEAWKKASAERDAAVILAHVQSMKSSPTWAKNGGEYIPAPLVYLNQRRWEGASPAHAEQSGILAGAI